MNVKKAAAKKPEPKPEPVEPQPLRCKVIGNHAIDGVQPGETLVLSDRGRVRYLLRAGHISCPLTDGDLVALTEAGL